MPPLFWLDASRIVLMGLAIVEPDTGRVTPVVGVPEYAEPAPDGSGVAWLADEELHLLRWGEAERTVALPAGLTVAPRAAWLGDGRVLLVEQDVNADVFRCFTWSSDTWTTAAHCPEGAFLQIHSLVAGPRDLYAIGSAGEGNPAVTVARYTPEAGQRNLPTPFGDLFPYGWVDVTFHPDGRTATLLTRCMLADPDGRPCEGHEGIAQDWPLNAWSWHVGARVARLAAVGLPAEAVMDPTGTRYAWADGGRIGVRGLDGGAMKWIEVPSPK